MAPDNYRFAESDSLLCFHGPMLYEAKCLKRRKSSDGKAQYFIHYKGWNSKWEEWVDDDRVLTVNTANMNKMASLKEIHSNSKKSASKRSITVIKEETTRTVTPPVKGRKRKHSEISADLNQTVNVPSPSDPKPKKRGRPPKIATPKIEVDQTTEAPKVTEVSKRTTEVSKAAADISKRTTEVSKATADISKRTTEVSKATAEISKSTEVSKTNEVSKAAKVAEVSKAPKIAEVSKAAKVAEVSKAAKVAEISKPTKVAEISKPTKVAELSKPTKVTEVSKVAEISKATKVTEISNVVEVTKVVEEPNVTEVSKEIEVTVTTDNKTETETAATTEPNKTVEPKSTSVVEETVTSEITTVVENNLEVSEATEVEKIKVTETVEETKIIIEETIPIVETNAVEETNTIEDTKAIEEYKINERMSDDGDNSDVGEMLEFNHPFPSIEDMLTTDEETEDMDTTETIDINELTESTKIIKENETTEGVINTEATEVTNETKTETMDGVTVDAEDDIFTVPAPVPVVKTLPVINIPEKLKLRMAYDNTQIKENDKVLKFPEEYTIEHLVELYISEKNEIEDKGYWERAYNTGLSVIQYFNILVHSELLYTKERELKMNSKARKLMFKKVRSGIIKSFKNRILLTPKKLWHCVYGPTHLLRLFVKLPMLLSDYIYSDIQLAVIAENMEDFLNFLENHYATFFSNDDYEDII